MNKRTALYDQHVAMGGKMVDFAGWDMPLHYGSQVREHHAVRKDAGMFDVSHMAVIDLHGEKVRDFLRKLLANNVDKLTDAGKALYSCMLKPNGGVIDDLIVYFQADTRFRMVVNAGTREKDLAWINEQAGAFDVSVTERQELAMIAVQGPNARDRVHAVIDAGLAERAAQLKPFFAAWDDSLFIARTGYTGEDGYEIIVPGEDAPDLFQRLRDEGVAPIGLGARDTLRLEAGMNLYGTDMDEETSPLESGLGWTIAWQPEERDFIGRKALQGQKDAGLKRKLVGIVLQERGVLRNHQPVFCGGGECGELTSGSFSPTLGKSIALARVSIDAGSEVEVEVRGKRLQATVVKPPFVRNGKSCLEDS